MSTLLSGALLAACTTPAAEHTAQGDAEAPSTLRLLERLPGHWVHEDPEGDYRFEEHWTSSAGNGLEGLGVVRSGKDTIMIEHLGIQETDSGVWYSARIATQNNGTPVLFRMEHDKDSLVFTNAEHDYPQRIAYLPRPDGGWNVHLAGMRNGTTVSEQLRFVRMQESL
jgi:hypothetical protein